MRGPEWALMVCALASGCGDNISDDLYFTFDDRQVLCGFSIDEHVNPVDWDRLQDRIDVAAAERWVLNVYAHTPGVTVSHETLDRAFGMFERAGLELTSYPISNRPLRRSPALHSRSTTTRSTRGSPSASYSRATARRSRSS